jgi:gliding motility-associated-like protein
MKQLLLFTALFFFLTLQAGNVPPPCPSLTMTGTNVSCYGYNNGTAQVSIAGGSGNYSLSWSNGINNAYNPALAVGTYTVNVIDNVSGCSVNGAYVVSAPNPLANTGIVTNVNCFNGNTGAINLTSSGGVAPYSYSWTNAIGNQVAQSEDVNNLFAGNYVVHLTDNNGCTLNTPFSISQPIQALDNQGLITNVSCYAGSNGTIDVLTWGGTPPYAFVWSNGNNNEDVSGLPAGAYNLTITDSKGCTKSSNFSISQPTAISATTNVSNVICFGFANGIATVSASGGTAPYSYVWNNSQSVFGINAATLSNVIADNYSVLIQDANGCTFTANTTITQPSDLISSLTFTNVNCFGGNDGSINLSVSGGSFPYTYSWSNSLGQVVSSQQDLNGIAADTFLVTITDANGCIDQLSQVISQPLLPLSTTTSVINVACFGNSTGQVMLTAAGGTLPYQYNWLSGQNTVSIQNLIAGTYGFTITDAHNCNVTGNATVTQPNAPISISQIIIDANCFGYNDGAINTTVLGGTVPYAYSWTNSLYALSATTQDLTSLPAEVYGFTVVDAQGCTLSDTFIVNQPSLLTTSLSGVNILCFGDSTGTINLTISGGTQPYSQLWSNGMTSEDLLSIPSGMYSVTVSDAHGCVANDSLVLTQPNSPLTHSFVVENVKCRDGSDGEILLTISGGTNPFDILWSNGDTTINNTGLTAGSYSFVITDVNGCINTDSAFVNQPLALTTNENITPVTCYGLSDGIVDMTTSGGTAPYDFTWFNSTFALSSQTEDLNGFPFDTYQVEITDSNGCFYEYFFTVSQPDSLNITYDNTVVSCNGGSDASINVTVTGGNPSYAYLWSNNQTTEDLTNLGAGIYSLVVTDQKNCQDSIEIVIIQPEPVTVTFDVETISCIDQHDGSAIAYGHGGVGAFTYAWSNGITTANNDSLYNQTYSITVTDALGCTGNDSVVIPINPISCIRPVNCFTPNGDNFNDAWMIDNMYLYPGFEMKIFNIWGNLIHSQENVFIPWDGTYRSNPLPNGTYYYIINLNYLDRQAVTGFITILK